MNQLMFVSLEVGMTDDELKECIHQMAPVCDKLQSGYLLSIAGYDKDKRELWDIPEVVQFCQRLIDIGFISVLEVSCAEKMEALGVKNGMTGFTGMPGFGVLEVYLIANKSLELGDNDVGVETFEKILKVVKEANAKAKKILAEPCPDTGMRKIIQDGQHQWTPIKFGRK